MGKKEGAPIILGVGFSLWRVPEVRRRDVGETYKDAIEGFGVVRCGELAGVLHVCSQVPELLQTDAGDVDDVVRL